MKSHPLLVLLLALLTLACGQDETKPRDIPAPDPAAKPVTPETMVERYFVKHAKVQLNSGSSYGVGGAGRMRMNVATSRKLVELALTNMASALRNPQLSML